MTYSEAEARIAELRQRLENIKSTLGAGDIGISVDPQAVASAQTQAYHEQFTPQGYVSPQQGTEMFPAASTAVATMPPEQQPEFLPPGDSFLGNLAKGVPRLAASQAMLGEQIYTDPKAAAKGLAEFGVGAVEKLGLGLGETGHMGRAKALGEMIERFAPGYGLKEPKAIAERKKELTEEFLNYPFEYFVQITAPFFLGMGGPKLAAKAKTVYNRMKVGKSFKDATVSTMDQYGIATPESAIAKWDQEIGRRLEQPKPAAEPSRLPTIPREELRAELQKKVERPLKSREKPSVGGVGQPQLDAIESMDRGLLADEGLRLLAPEKGRKAAIDQIVNMSVPELRYLVSGGRIGKEVGRAREGGKGVEKSGEQAQELVAGKERPVRVREIAEAGLETKAREVAPPKVLAKEAKQPKPKGEKPVDLEAGRLEEVVPIEKTQRHEKPTPSPEPIGLKKAEIENIRRNTGLDQLEAAERRGWEEVLHKAKNEKVDETILQSADEIIKSGRQISDVEHAGMVVKATKLADEYDASIKTVNQLIERGDVAAARLENARSESIIAQMDKLTEASDIGGREAARTLSIRRMMVNRETYDLAHIVQKAQAAKGEKLTTAERGKFEQMTAEHTKLQEKLKSVEANYDKLVAERELMTAEKVAATERKKAKIERRKTVLREKIQTERADIKKQLTDMGYRVNDVTGVTAEGSYLVGKLAVNYIKDGAVSLDAVVKQVLTDLPQLTKRDVYQSLITKDPKVQAKARTETIKRVGQLKTQARLLLEIEKVETGVFEPRTPGQKVTQPVAIRQLQKKLRELRATAYKSNMSAARLEKAVKTINELQDQLANNYRSIKKGKPELTPDLSVAREKIKDLRKTMHVTDELAKTQEQLRSGNFDIKVKPVEKPILPELERAQIRLKVNRKRIRQAIKEMEPMTLKKAGVEAINTARTLKATADMSAVLRQGLVLSVRHPIKAGKAFGESFKAFFSEYTAEQIYNTIISAPEHYIREKSGLYLSEVGGRVIRGEEMFMSSVAEKIPLYGRIVRASERHMVSFLNMIRTAAFDYFLKKYPNATHAELKAWANFVNVASGRGNLRSLAGFANTLSLGFFAPKFAISRVQIPLALFTRSKKGVTRRVRMEIAKDLVATASLGATALTLAHLAGAEVGTDPRSADWGKIKVGNTRIDIWGGMQQPMRVVARTGLGITDKWGWTGEGLTDWQKDVDPMELAARFSQYKFSPLATIPLELYKGKTIVGEDVEPSETAIKAMIPMVYEDMRDAWRLEGAGQAAWVGALAFFGVGASTYSRKEGRENTIRKLLKDAEQAESTEIRKKKESAAKALQTRWNKLNPEDRISIL
jgi:hypothetical protein